MPTLLNTLNLSAALGCPRDRTEGKTTSLDRYAEVSRGHSRQWGSEGMAEILWHRRETKRETEKTKISLKPRGVHCAKVRTVQRTSRPIVGRGYCTRPRESYVGAKGSESLSGSCSGMLTEPPYT